MSFKTGLIAAAFSSCVGVDIKQEADAIEHSLTVTDRSVSLIPIAMPQLYSFTYDSLTTVDDSCTVGVLGKSNQEYFMDSLASVQDIKKSLAATIGIHPRCQTLLYKGRRLADHQSLKAQHVPGGSKVMLAWGPSDNGPEPVHYIKDSELDPQFDYDFTNKKDDGSRFVRGEGENEHIYERPYGWDRCAIRVLGKYSNDVWLGQPGLRFGPSAGEWAVSYHGTKVDNIGSIADSGFDNSKSKRQQYGSGIYSTPSIKVASEYAPKFTYRGSSYQVVLQNRVNLEESEVVPSSTTGARADYFVTQDQSNIRPYGVCLKKI